MSAPQLHRPQSGGAGPGYSSGPALLQPDLAAVVGAAGLIERRRRRQVAERVGEPGAETGPDLRRGAYSNEGFAPVSDG